MIVPSSTSSSEVGGPWGRTWLLALVLAATTLGLVESAWRARGFAPAVTDSARLWSAHRWRAEGLAQPGSVVVGASRAQYALDLPAFADETGWPAPIQLAIQGRSPLPVLKDLAADPSFRGLVIVEVTERILFERSRQRELKATRRVAESRELAVNQTARLESALDEWVGGTFAFRNPELAVDRLLFLSQGGYAILPRERWVEADRSAKMDFARVDAASQEQKWLSRLEKEPATPARVRDRILSETKAAVETIRARGGEVVFVRFPSGGRLAALENQKFPRDAYWDVLVERVGGPAIHFADYEDLRAAPTPDGSHLDVRDTEPFTRALARILVERLASRTGT